MILRRSRAIFGSGTRAFSVSVKRLENEATKFSELPELRKRPQFALNSKYIHILRTPNEFYTNLLNIIRQAKKRILISSLYIGVEELELIQTLHESLASNPSLKLTVLLDLNRSTRHERRGSSHKSTAHMLLPLLEKFPDQVDVYMFRSPKLKGLLARIVPARFNEGWGTWHSKIYASDDDFIVSGANLSSSYFRDRQDRYMHFEAQHEITDYFESFLTIFSQFSYRLALASSKSPSNLAVGDIWNLIRAEDGTFKLEWQNASLHPLEFEHGAGEAIRMMQSTFASNTTSRDLAVKAEGSFSRTNLEGEEEDTMIYPLIQSGILGVQEEEHVLRALFDHLRTPHGSGNESSTSNARSMIDLTSGYFALHEPYQAEAMLEGLDWRILAASPKANGFYASKGVSGRIPEGYTLLEQVFWMRLVEHARCWRENEHCFGGTGVELREWYRDGWTYHAKGVWFSQNNNGINAVRNNPYATLIGSTNLNLRSATLDTELSLLVTTQSSSLRESLGDEMRELWKDSHAVDENVWRNEGRAIGSVSLGTRIIMHLVGHML